MTLYYIANYPKDGDQFFTTDEVKVKTILLSGSYLSFRAEPVFEQIKLKTDFVKV